MRAISDRVLDLCKFFVNTFGSGAVLYVIYNAAAMPEPLSGLGVTTMLPFVKHIVMI